MGDMADDHMWAEEIAAGALDAPPPDDDPQCPRWDLPASMCGCPAHRGGKTPQEEAAAEREHFTPSNWFTAARADWCVRGEHDTDPGDTIRYDGGRDDGIECRGCCS
jgi:hypothetical protein